MTSLSIKTYRADGRVWVETGPCKVHPSGFNTGVYSVASVPDEALDGITILGEPMLGTVPLSSCRICSMTPGDALATHERVVRELDQGLLDRFAAARAARQTGGA